MLPYLFVIVPLILYISALFYETYYSFRRIFLFKKQEKYLSATWEITHTLLVLSITYFITMFGLSLRDVSSGIFIPLFIAIFVIIIRGILYLYIFYIKDNRSKNSKNIIDWLFAASHIAIILALLFAVIKSVTILWGKQAVPNSDFIVWMWPGLIIVVILCLIPLVKLYRIEK